MDVVPYRNPRLRTRGRDGETHMKVVICDDSIEDLLKIDRLMRKYQELGPGRDFELEKFSDAALLYRRIREGELADIYVLDMIMPTRSGIDIGSLIRSPGRGGTIIYVTSSDDFALDAYGVHAVRYLLKPVSEEQLFEAMDYALSQAEARRDPVYLVKTREGMTQIPYSRIEYIENAARRLEVHMAGGETLKSIFIRKSFDEEIGEVARERNFLQVHKSFLVNLDYVKRMTQEGIEMECGGQLPVSRNRAAQVKREYLLYVSEKYR